MIKRLPVPLRWLLLGVLIAAIAACALLLSHEQITPHGAVATLAPRIGIIVLSLLGWFLSQSLIASRGPQSERICDVVHDRTAWLHRWLVGHPRTANAGLIGSSAMIDCLGMFLIAASIFGSTIRPFAALLILFVMRQACQGLCVLPTPPGMIWRYPGFPSLLVTYDVANDFFFSGHTSIAVLGAIEIALLCPWWLGVVGMAIALMEASVVLVYRAHYTMDIFTAVVAAFSAEQMAGWLCGLG
jgi:hypothetical protein